MLSTATGAGRVTGHLVRARPASVGRSRRRVRRDVLGLHGSLGTTPAYGRVVAGMILFRGERLGHSLWTASDTLKLKSLADAVFATGRVAVPFERQARPDAHDLHRSGFEPAAFSGVRGV